MSFALDPTSAQPAYVQIANWLDGRIRADELPAGDKLPSERALCAQTGAARGTVRYAYRELEKRGLVRTVPGSGVYVTERRHSEDHSNEQKAVAQAIDVLRAAGLNRGEIAAIAQNCAWARLQDQERPRLAWVDCCPEMLAPIAREIEVECGFSVEPLLLYQMTANPCLLAREQFQTIATSIEHYDELEAAAREVLQSIGSTIVRVVLSLTSQSIGGIASMQPGERVAVVNESPQFFTMARRYLIEFGVKANPTPVPIGTAMGQLFANENGFHWVILPPDGNFHDGVCGRIAAEAEKRGMRALHLRHAVDFGSLRHLKALARANY